MPALSHCAYHSKQVEGGGWRWGVGGYWVGTMGEGCVWHENSHQGLDIHQGPWPTVRINFVREPSRALLFVCASICRCLSHIPASVFTLHLCLLVFYQSFSDFLPFFHTFSSHHLLFRCLFCYFAFLISTVFSSFPLIICHQAIMNQGFFLIFGGW